MYAPIMSLSRSELRLARVLNLGHALNHLVLLIFPTAVIALSQEFGRSYESLLPLAFPGFVAWGVCALPAGWLGDRWGRRPMMLVSFFGTGLACVLVSLANSPFQLGLALTLLGIVAAIYHPVGYAILGGLPQDSIGRTMGINGLWGNLGVAFAAIVTGALTDLVSWRAAFFVPGLVCILGGFAFLASANAVRAAGGLPVRRIVRLERPMLMRLFIILMGLAILGSLIFNGTTIVMPKLFEQGTDIASSGTFGIGVLVCVVFSFAALAQTLVGNLIDRMSIRALVVPMVALQIPLLVATGYAEGWLLVLVAFTMMFCVFGQNPIGEVMVARYADDAIRARLNAVRFCVTSGIGAAAIPMMAHLYGLRQDFSLAFVALAVFSAVMLGFALWYPTTRALDAAVKPASDPQWSAAL